MIPAHAGAVKNIRTVTGSKKNILNIGKPYPVIVRVRLLSFYKHPDFDKYLLCFRKKEGEWSIFDRTKN